MSTDVKSDELATSLAVDAIKQVGKRSFTVYADMSIDKPETLENFELLKRIQLDAYRRGAAEAIQAKENEALPSIVGAIVRRMRMYSINLVFHNGKIEGGPGKQNAAEALELAIKDQGFSLELTQKLKREILTSLWDASNGFDSIRKAN